VSHSVVVDPLDEIRILHVDDDVNQSEFLQYFLPEMDEAFRIDFVSDPCQVMEKMGSEIYDCVVTDYQMPKMNGIELAEKIRESFDIPIIIYTGQGSEEIAEAAFSAGIDDYLRKEMDPSHYQVLAKRIRNVVEKKRVDTLYRAVIEQTRDAMAILVDNKVVFANKAFLNILGLKDLNDIPENPFEFAIGKDKERGIKRYKEAIKEGSSPGFNKYCLRAKDGSMVNVEVSTSPITYHGKIGALCMLRDVTERERLEAEKKETQDRLRSLVALAPDGIVTFDMKGVVTSVNSAFLKITGYELDEVLGKNFLKLKSLPNSDLASYFMVFSNLIKGSMPPPFEFKYIKKDRSLSWGEAHIGFIEVAGRREFIAILRDITERKRSSHFDQPKAVNTVWADTEIDNNLLLSIGQLAYLVGNEVLEPINEVRKDIDLLKKEPGKLDDIIEKTESSLEQALFFLEGFISRTDGSLLQPGEQDLVQIISKTIEMYNKGDLLIEAKQIGDMSANIDGFKLQGVLGIIIEKMSHLMDGSGKLGIVSESSDGNVKVKVSKLSKESAVKDRELLNKLRSDSDVLTCIDEVLTEGGTITFNKDLNPYILITLPIRMERKNMIELLSREDITQIIKK